MEEDRIYFAETDFRNKKLKFGIKMADRTKHTYIVGKSGMGKTTLLENMAIQDIVSGNGVGIVDPHGDFADKMLDYIPKERLKDVVYFNPVDMDYPIGFNIMEGVGEDQRHLVAAGLMGVFKKIWPDVWSARMEYILNNTVLALLEYPGSTLLGINRMLADKDYRKQVVDNIKDEVVKSFWTQEFAKYTERFAQEATPAIQNKIGQFITNPLMRSIVGQEKSSFNIRQLMDGKKIFIMNLSKGRVGESNSHLLGAMLITKIYLAAMSRVDIAEAERNPFYLYIDEFQNFATDAFANILSEARKYKLGLILAHQYIGQLVTETSTRVRDAVFGNVGTMMSFRVGAPDAEFLEKEFAPEFTIEDLINLPFARIYLKLMIDGVASRPFSATTLPPMGKPTESHRNAIVSFSQNTYGKPIQEIKEAISAWHAPVGEMIGIKTEAPKPQVPMFEAECTVCGKKISVPFKPDGKRPIYCPEHLSLVQQQKTITPAVSAPAVLQESPKKAEPRLPARQFAARPQHKREPLVGVPRFPGLREGEIVAKKPAGDKTISLKELENRSMPQPKKSQDLSELRRALSDALDIEPQENIKNSESAEESNRGDKILRPGQTIKFD